MTNRKCALLIFSKPPVPGLVKTRLTRERGGILTPEQAAEVLPPQPLRRERAFHARAHRAAARERRGRARRSDGGGRHLRLLRVHHPADNVELMRETYEAIGRGPWRCTT